MVLSLRHKLVYTNKPFIAVIKTPLLLFPYHHHIEWLQMARTKNTPHIEGEEAPTTKQTQDKRGRDRQKTVNQQQNGMCMFL